MNRDRNARENLRARTENARRNRPSEAREMPNPLLFLVVGGLLALAGMAVLAWMLALSFGGGDIDPLFPTMAPRIPRAAIPVSILLIAGVILFLGEMFRRARWSFREVELLSGGATTMRVRTLPLPLVLAWTALTAAIWAAIVPLPVAFSPRVASVRQPSDDFWLLSIVYGFMAAGFVGLFVTSMVKRLAYSRPPTKNVSAGERRFWRIASIQWRFEHWFGFVAGGVAGLLPLAAVQGSTSAPISPDAVLPMTLIAVVCGLIAIAGALASPRSGYLEGEAESVI